MTKVRHISDAQRFSIIESDDDFKQYCHRCGAHTSELHECFGGRNRQNSKDYGLVVTLCRRCHEIVHLRPNERHIYEQIGKHAWLHKYGDIEQFRAIFGRYYND